MAVLASETERNNKIGSGNQDKRKKIDAKIKKLKGLREKLANLEEQVEDSKKESERLAIKGQGIIQQQEEIQAFSEKMEGL